MDPARSSRSSSRWAPRSGLIYFLAKYADLTVNGQSQAIVSILVLGAGTDYALLLTARYREELRRHEDRHEAMAFALHRATPAIIASAATVIVGMLCLTLAEMNSTAGMGPVVAIGIGMGLLAMITLLPALLVIFGRWMFWPKRPTFGSDEPTTRGFWAGWATGSRPVRARSGSAPRWCSEPCALGVLTLDTSGLSTEESYTKEFDSVKGQHVLAEHGLADNSTPVMVVSNADGAAEVATALAGVDNLEQPSEPVVKDGVAFITANLTVDATSPEAFDTVDAARTAVHEVEGADALVGGFPAFLDDALKANARDSKVIIPVTLVVVLLILMLLLRALTAPLILIATVVLSFGAALGIGALAFKYVFDYPAVDSSFPLFVFVFLVSLGIDYNIFLMTRVREETPAHGTGKGCAGGAGRHGRRDHLRRPGARRHVRGARDAAAGVPGAARLHRGRGRHPRHAHRALGAGDRDQPRPRERRSGGRASSTAASTPTAVEAEEPPRRADVPVGLRGQSPGVAS